MGVGGGGGGEGRCVLHLSWPMCIFVFVIRVTARRSSLALRTKIKSGSLEVLCERTCFQSLKIV